MSKFETHPLPDTFNASGCTVVAPGKRSGLTFVRAPDGTVYTTSRRPHDMLRDWDANDLDRRHFAKLTGVPFSDLAAARKARKVQQAKCDKAREIDRVKRSAAKLGLRIVRANKYSTER